MANIVDGQRAEKRLNVTTKAELQRFACDQQLIGAENVK
jgi:hypothetical protein